MSTIGWSKKFEEYKAVNDIPSRVRKTEVAYWCSLFAGVAILLAGILIMQKSPQSPFGLFLAVCGVVNIALIKLWAHIRLTAYQIIMELRLKDKETHSG